MAVIAPLKAHLVKTSYNERSQPSKTLNGRRHITGSAIYSTRGEILLLVQRLLLLFLPLDFFNALVISDSTFKLEQRANLQMQ